MTNPTPHGQVPEALIDLIDAYAETRHRCGGIYNARTEAARKAVIEALSGAQALRAGPGASRAAPPSTYVNGAGIHAEDGASAVIRKLDARFHDIVTFKVADAAAASPTPPAEQQAAPKAAPGEQFDADGFRAWVRQNLPDDTIIGNSAWWADHLTTWAQRFVKAAPQQEAQRPWGYAWRQSPFGWGFCSKQAYEQAAGRGEEVAKLYLAPKPAPAPLSDDAERDAARYRWLRRWKGQEHEPPFTVQHEVDGTLWGGDLDAAVDAALAAQGGK